MIRPVSPRRLIFFLVSDGCLVWGALELADFLRITLGIGRAGPEIAFETPLAVVIIACLVWVLAYWQARVYSPHHNFALQLRRIITGHWMASLLFLGMLYITYRDYSRLQALYFIILAFMGIVIHRAVAWVLSKRMSQRLAPRRSVLIIGVSEYAREISRTIQHHEWAGLRVIGYLKYAPDDIAADGVESKILGTVEDLDTIIERYPVDEVVIYIKRLDDAVFSRVEQIVKLLQKRAVNIRLAPDYSELAYFYLSTEDFGGIPLIGVREAILSPVERVTKRGFDIIVSTLVMTLGSPLFVLIMLAIRLDSPGPAIFRQVRIGQYGRPFMMLKFRTMYVNSHAHHPGSKAPDDPRVTRVGRFLRRTSLDELPQFINVLRGEMSVVGPRPELPEFVEKYEWWQRKRFEMPQGVTGWWQVNGRAERPMYLNTEDDLFYISHYSLWLDTQIVLRTLLAVITGRGAY
jgi:exopolysaccharide biosynthesis polyprenyl glycosylphosphotransferase